MSNTTNTETSRLIDLAAERAVIACCLIDPRAITKIAAKLAPKDFYFEQHQIAYAALLRLSNRDVYIDTITLGNELQQTGQLELVGSWSGITEMSLGTPTALYVEHYAQTVGFCSLRRRAADAAQKIAMIAYGDAEDQDELIDQVESAAMAVSGKSRDGQLEHIQVSVKSLTDRIAYLADNPGRLVGIPTGFKMLDHMLGGLHKGSLHILAGRPGMGKSALAMTIARNAAKEHGARVAVFSLEMSKDELTNRLMSMATGIDSHKLNMGRVADSDWPRIMEEANNLQQLSIHIDDTPGATVNDVRTKARRLHADQGLDLILIDYMQLMSGQAGKDKSENRQQEISHISRALKGLARELDVPVIALSQLSRAVESRADKRPMLSDLRESGSIEQDSDVVMFIYRDDYYDEDSENQNIADVIVAKHRHGSTGTIRLFFRKELTQFRDLEVTRTELN